MRLNHPIFREPLAAQVTFDKSDPWEPEADPRGLWTVQTGAMGQENDYGVVSDGHGFEDSPDCERISGGQNSKGPHALAIGRQANMMQWGFYCAPDRMTKSARKAFLNAIVYMKRFDGHRPLVKKVARSRDWLAQYVQMVRDLDTRYRQAGDRFRSYIEQRFPEEVIAKHGLDADALESWRRANLEYVFGERGKFRVDADLKELKLSNRKPAFLDWLVARLSEDQSNEPARRLAARYLGDHAEQAVPFIQANRKWLFFSDTGGFRWFVDENAKARAETAGQAR